MSADETTRLRALLKRATQTPWRQDGAEITVAGSGKTVIAECTLPDCLEVADEDREEQEQRNAALIVAAVNALRGLLDAAERAERAERERDDLAATLETRNAEHALAVEQLAAVTAEHDLLGSNVQLLMDLIAKQFAILTAVADALKGPPPALSSHSHHDLGAVAAATVAQQAPLVACVDALRAAATAAGWRDADATGETLVAWVRRGALLDAARIAMERGGEWVAKAIVARVNEEWGAM